MRGFLKFAVLPVMVLIAGYILPGYLIPDGVDRFEGENRGRAEAALRWAQPEFFSDSDPDPEDL